MLKDMTLGQYFPGKSPIHRLDPRTKLLIAIIYIVTAFLAKNWVSYGVLLLSAPLLVCLSRISLRVVLRGIRPVLFIFLITSLIHIFFTNPGDGAEPLVAFWKITVYTEGIYRAILMVVRVLVIIVGTSVLITYTTSPIRLTDGIELLLKPIEKPCENLPFTVHDFAMAMSIALRFIPTFVEDTDKIMSAQKARGADFTSGGLIARAKALLPILIPLLLSSFRRAEDLATAMECRCYRGGSGRTKMVTMHMTALDVYAFAATALFLALILCLNAFLPFGYIAV